MASLVWTYVKEMLGDYFSSNHIALERIKKYVPFPRCVLPDRNAMLVHQQQRYPGCRLYNLFIYGICSDGNFAGRPSALVCSGF